MTNVCAKHAAQPDVRKRNELRKLYWTKLWRVHTRNAVLSRDPVCKHVENGIGCQRLSTDVDHIIDAEVFVAQGGDFYDPDNLRGLCHSHHSRRTARDQGFASGQ